MSVMTPGDYVSKAQKSVTFNQFVTDFVNDTGDSARQYDARLLNTAYRSSVFLFASLKRIAGLLQTIPVVIEVKQNKQWVRARPDHYLYDIFDSDLAKWMYESYMETALYGRTMAYKRKSRQGLALNMQGTRDPVTISNNGVAGFHVVRYYNYTLDQDWERGSVRGFNITQPGLTNTPTGYLHRNECIYYHEYDPRDENEGTSIVALAINNAITNAAIAKWAAHYFTTGAMPLLLISTEDDPNIQTEADLARNKNRFLNQWRGIWGSLRAIMTNRKMNIQEVGIDAERVTAPELDQAALNNISAAVGLPADLIVPPPGGSDNARHKHLMRQVWTQTVLPLAEQFIAQLGKDLGLPDGCRLHIDYMAIPALDADRADIAEIEQGVFSSGLETWNEARIRMRMPPRPEMKDVFLNDGKLITLDRFQREQELIDKDLLAVLQSAYDSDLLTIGQVHERLDMELPPGVDENAYKFQLTAVGESPDPFSAPGRPPALPAPKPDSPSNGGAPTALLPGQTAPISAGGPIVPVDDDKSPTSAKAVTREMYLTLNFSDDATLYQMQKSLDYDPAAYVEPATFHLTLAQLPQATHESIGIVRHKLPVIAKKLKPPSIILTGIDHFDNGDVRPVYVTVRTTDHLLAYRSEILRTLDQYGVKFDDNYEYVPHITLAYPDMDERGGGYPEATGKIEPKILMLSVSDFSAELVIPISKPVKARPKKKSVPLEQRRQWALALLNWDKSQVERPDIPDDLYAEIVVSTANWKATRSAALQAINAGLFDKDAVRYEPTLLRYIIDGKAYQADPMGELKAWERAALRSRMKAVERFEVEHIPRVIEGEVRTSLQLATDATEIRGVFVQARAKMFTPLTENEERAVREWRVKAQAKSHSDEVTRETLPRDICLFIDWTLKNTNIGVRATFEAVEMVMQGGVSPYMDNYRLYSGVKAIQATQLDFEWRFGAGLDDATTGKVERRRWAQVVRGMLRIFGYRAFRDGLKDGGRLDDELDSDETDVVKAMLKDQSVNVTQLGDTLFKGKGLSEKQARQRIGMWFKGSVMPFYEAGKLAADKNALHEWVMNPLAEHCVDCKKLNGQRHPLKGFHERGLVPGRGNTDCKNGCQCGLVRTIGRSRGRYLVRRT
jgi:2'-5' RNA ligase